MTKHVRRVKTAARPLPFFVVLLFAFAAALAAATLPDEGTARGDQRTRDAAQVDQARQRMEKGQSLFAQQHYAEAMAEFEAAYQVMPFGAFLYNAALAAEKAKDRQRAIARYKEFLASDPNVSDAAAIKATIARLEAELSAPSPDADGGAPEDGGGVPTGIEAPESGATMRSLVLIESEPPGAPLSIYERVVPTAARFQEGAENPGWRKVLSGARTPHDLSLGVGHYHVVLDAFQDFRRSATDINLAPGHVYTFKANLSQGAFLGFLKVISKVEGARIYVDDPPPHKNAPWGRTPHGGLVNAGEHQIWVEATGYETFTKKLETAHGETVEVAADLSRVGYGFLRIDGNSSVIEVEVDGKPHGVYESTSSGLRVQLPAGKHRVVLDADGKKAYEGDLDVPRGQEVGVHATLIDTPSKAGAIGVGIAAIGAGVTGGVMLKLSGDQAPEKADLYKYIGYGGIIGGAGLGVISVVLFIYDPNPDSLAKVDKPTEFREDQAGQRAAAVRPRIRAVAPIVMSNGGGVAATGSF